MSRSDTFAISWLKALKNDRRAIFTAASYAQRAADFLSGIGTTITTMQEEAA
jgi:antirestriction protein ArdC